MTEPLYIHGEGYEEQGPEIIGGQFYGKWDDDMIESYRKIYKEYTDRINHGESIDEIMRTIYLDSRIFSD